MSAFRGIQFPFFFFGREGLTSSIDLAIGLAISVAVGVAAICVAVCVRRS